MMRCSATWPIRDVAERNYATPCPSLWHLEEKESGICVAPATYTGPCQPRFSFKNYDADMKKSIRGTLQGTSNGYSKCRRHCLEAIFEGILPHFRVLRLAKTPANYLDFSSNQQSQRTHRARPYYASGDGCLSSSHDLPSI